MARIVIVSATGALVYADQVETARVEREATVLAHTSNPGGGTRHWPTASRPRPCAAEPQPGVNWRASDEPGSDDVR